MTSYPYTLPDETCNPDSDMMTIRAWCSSGFYLYHCGRWFHASFNEVTDLFTVLRPLTEDEKKEGMVNKIRTMTVNHLRTFGDGGWPTRGTIDSTCHADYAIKGTYTNE